jgi:hypothetical protein
LIPYERIKDFVVIFCVCMGKDIPIGQHISTFPTRKKHGSCWQRDEESIAVLKICNLWDMAVSIRYLVATQFQESIFSDDQSKKYGLWTVFHNPPPIGAPHYHLLEAHVQCTKYMVVGGGGGGVEEI